MSPILRTILCLSCACRFLVGCSAPVVAPAGVPFVQQLQQQDDSLKGQRLRTLLDFERDSDLVFVQSSPVPAIGFTAHTGNGSAHVTAATISLRISSVLFGTKLPDNWTLIGAYVRPPESQGFILTLLDGTTSLAEAFITAAPGRWTLISIDLTNPSLATAIGNAQKLSLRLDTPGAGGGLVAYELDDVLLIDNTRSLLDTTAQGGWSIAQRGYTTTIDAPGRFRATAIAAAAKPDGWLMAEYSAARVILRSNGPTRIWTLFSDGRQIRDGQMQATDTNRAAVDSHQLPANVEVDEATGRLNRHTPGDSDNDGYNELSGAYQIVAKSSRVELTIRPHRGPAVAPVLEITGLPKGTVSATLEGRFVPVTSVLPDGRVLIVLPVRIDHSTTVVIKSSSDNRD